MMHLWETVAIGNVAKPVDRSVEPMMGNSYRQIGVRLWGAGAYERETIDGGDTRYKTLNRTEVGDIIVNKIWARNGSASVVLDGQENCFCSSEFPLFAPNKDRLDYRWFYWITKTHWFWNECDLKSKGTSGKNRIRPEKFLEILIPLPPIVEQRRIVERLEMISNKIHSATSQVDLVDKEIQAFLRSAFHLILSGAPMMKMSEVAPIVRRPVSVKMGEEYHELGVKSFGKGTFHKPPLDYLEVGTKKLYYIEPGDLVFSNVFAWEGAIAVAKPQDTGRVGSHRFITCIPKPGISTPDFLCFYFLTPEGLEKIGFASPGGAGRNRTLGLEKLEQIEVPVPEYSKQIKFNKLLSMKRMIASEHVDSIERLVSLSNAILDKAFKGEL